MKSDFEYLNSKYEKSAIFDIEKMVWGVTNVAAIHLILVFLLPNKNMLYLRHRETIWEVRF